MFPHPFGGDITKRIVSIIIALCIIISCLPFVFADSEGSYDIVNDPARHYIVLRYYNATTQNYGSFSGYAPLVAGQYAGQSVYWNWDYLQISDLKAGYHSLCLGYSLISMTAGLKTFEIDGGFGQSTLYTLSDYKFSQTTSVGVVPPGDNPAYFQCGSITHRKFDLTLQNDLTTANIYVNSISPSTNRLHAYDSNDRAVSSNLCLQYCYVVDYPSQYESDITDALSNLATEVSEINDTNKQYLPLIHQGLINLYNTISSQGGNISNIAQIVSNIKSDTALINQGIASITNYIINMNSYIQAIADDVGLTYDWLTGFLAGHIFTTSSSGSLPPDLYYQSGYNLPPSIWGMMFYFWRSLNLDNVTQFPYSFGKFYFDGGNPTGEYESEEGATTWLNAISQSLFTIANHYVASDSERLNNDNYKSALEIGNELSNNGSLNGIADFASDIAFSNVSDRLSVPEATESWFTKQTNDDINNVPLTRGNSPQIVTDYYNSNRSAFLEFFGIGEDDEE